MRRAYKRNAEGQTRQAADYCFEEGKDEREPYRRDRGGVLRMARPAAASRAWQGMNGRNAVVHRRPSAHDAGELVRFTLGMAFGSRRPAGRRDRKTLLRTLRAWIRRPSAHDAGQRLLVRDVHGVEVRLSNGLPG